MAVTDLVTPYPFDPTGALLSNLVPSEQQIVTPPNFRDFYFLIPKAAPYFGDSLVITLKDLENQSRTLVEGVDFYPTHRFISASRATAKPIYGSITLLDKELAGVVTLKYQTIGGIWTIDEATAAEVLANTLLNPRITSWEVVVDQPIAFPPIDHEWDLVDMVGATEMVEAIDRITAALNESGGNAITQHIADLQNPHKTTATQVGLGNVQNYAIATDPEATAGLRNDVYMTALRVKSAISFQAGALLKNHTDDHANPHVVTKQQVGLGVVDNFATATNTETVAGALSNRFTTPAGVKAAIDNFSTTTFASHVNNKLNPHEVDKLQVGLALVENFAPAGINDAQAGTRNDMYMTPLRVRQAIQALAGGDIDVHITDMNNPHQTTKAQVGLGSVQNFGVADSPTTIAGTSVSLYTTPKGVVDAIKSLVANDYFEHSINTANPHQVTAEQVGAYTKAAINTLLSGYLPVDGKAVDSHLFDGLTTDQVAQYVLLGKAANSTLFDGRDVDTYKAYVLQGKAADSTLFAGQTLQQVIAAAAAGSDFEPYTAAQRMHGLAALVGAETFNWTPIGQVNFPDNVDVVAGNPDTQWFIAGGDDIADLASTLYYVRCSVRNAGTGAARLSVQVLNMAGVATGGQFGWTYDATAKTAVVYLKTAKRRNQMTVTELNKGVGAVIGADDVLVVEPTGITYVVEDGLATTSQLAAMETQMADAVKAISQAFSGMVPDA